VLFIGWATEQDFPKTVMTHGPMKGAYSIQNWAIRPMFTFQPEIDKFRAERAEFEADEFDKDWE
jgi:hypothetical protein